MLLLFFSRFESLNYSTLCSTVVASFYDNDYLFKMGHTSNSVTIFWLL